MALLWCSAQTIKTKHLSKPPHSFLGLPVRSGRAVCHRRGEAARLGVCGWRWWGRLQRRRLPKQPTDSHLLQPELRYPEAAPIDLHIWFHDRPHFCIITDTSPHLPRPSIPRCSDSLLLPQTPPPPIHLSKRHASLKATLVGSCPPTAPWGPSAAAACSVVGLHLSVTHIHPRPTHLLCRATAWVRSWRGKRSSWLLCASSAARCVSVTKLSGGPGAEAAGLTPATPPLTQSLPERRKRMKRRRRRRRMVACFMKSGCGIAARGASSLTEPHLAWRHSMRRRRGMKQRRRRRRRSIWCDVLFIYMSLWVRVDSGYDIICSAFTVNLYPPPLPLRPLILSPPLAAFCRSSSRPFMYWSLL